MDPPRVLTLAGVARRPSDRTRASPASIRLAAGFNAHRRDTAHVASNLYLYAGITLQSGRVARARGCARTPTTLELPRWGLKSSPSNRTWGNAEAASCRTSPPAPCFRCRSATRLSESTSATQAERDPVDLRLRHRRSKLYQRRDRTGRAEGPACRSDRQAEPAGRTGRVRRHGGQAA